MDANEDALETSTPPTAHVGGSPMAFSTPEPVTALPEPVAEEGVRVAVDVAIAVYVDGAQDQRGVSGDDDDAVISSYQRESSDGEGGGGDVEVDVEVEGEGWSRRGEIVKEADGDDGGDFRSLDTSREVSVEGDARFGLWDIQGYE